MGKSGENLIWLIVIIGFLVLGAAIFLIAGGLICQWNF